MGDAVPVEEGAAARGVVKVWVEVVVTHADGSVERYTQEGAVGRSDEEEG